MFRQLIIKALLGTPFAESAAVSVLVYYRCRSTYRSELLRERPNKARRALLDVSVRPSALG